MHVVIYMQLYMLTFHSKQNSINNYVFVMCCVCVCVHVRDYRFFRSSIQQYNQM